MYDKKNLAKFPRLGELAPEAMRRAIEAARRFRAVTYAMQVARVDAIATEAVQRATNGGDLVEAITREAGIEVRVLSGLEEARYAALCASSGFYRPSGLIGDMGGGSLEVA